MLMVGIPRQIRVGIAPEITIDDEASDDTKEAFHAFYEAAQADPRTLQSALRNGSVLSSPQRVIASAELGDYTDEKLEQATNILARFFETRADLWVEYDIETHKTIQEGIQEVDTDVARSWRIDVFLGRLSMALDSQPSNTVPPVPPPDQHPFAAAA